MHSGPDRQQSPGNVDDVLADDVVVEADGEAALDPEQARNVRFPPPNMFVQMPTDRSPSPLPLVPWRPRADEPEPPPPPSRRGRFEAHESPAETEWKAQATENSREPEPNARHDALPERKAVGSAVSPGLPSDRRAPGSTLAHERGDPTVADRFSRRGKP